MNEEERDLEQELKEEKDRFERQNQEAYDKEVSGEAELKRQEEKRIRKGEKRRYQRLKRKQTQTGGNTGEKFIPDKTGDFAPAPDRDMRTGEPIYDPETDQFGNPRFAESIGFEVGANVALDKATSLLLGAPIPGARPLYALANVAGSGIINYLAQRIRGTEFSLGELATASGLSLIPGATQAKTLKGAIGKSTVKGAGLGAAQVTSESLIDTGKLPDAETFTTGTLFGGVAGGIFQTVADAGEVSYALRSLKDKIAGRGGSFTELGTVGAAKRKPGPKNPDEQAAMEAAGQKNLMKSFQEDPRLGESDEALTAQYRALDAKYDGQTLGDTVDEGLTNAQRREIYGRKLESTDLDLIIQEEALNGNNIAPEKAQEYVDLVNETRLGKKDRNNPSGRLRRNQKGYIGTMVYLNEVSLGVNPNTLGNTADVINHISKEIGTDPIGLKRIIEGQGGEISFQTEGMTAPVKIRSLTDLKKAYYLRLARYKQIPAFEKGHVFAANNIIEDRNISSLTDFYNNLEPEISRSIREQLDDQAIEELIAAKGRLKNDDFFRSVVDGNRKRQNNQEPDKILADLLGTQYGLRESFLSFVFPERSLSNTIPIESKAAFAELYRKELLAEIKGLKADLKNSGQSSVGPAYIDQLKIDVARSVAKGMKDNELLNAIILVDDKINKRTMTQKGEALPTRDDPIKTDDDGVIRGNTPD
tara:strand:- start:1055 stop:3163 length:2109 start_codon:yes stop_codon:yes gene_type:complete